MPADVASAVPAIEVRPPDLGRWAAGNTGIPYAWRFEAVRPGPTVLLQALTHGNEVEHGKFVRCRHDVT